MGHLRTEGRKMRMRAAERSRHRGEVRLGEREPERGNARAPAKVDGDTGRWSSPTRKASETPDRPQSGCNGMAKEITIEAVRKLECFLKDYNIECV